MRLRRLFPEAPDGDIAETEGVPVEVEHVRVESEDAVARHALRRRNESSKAGVNLGASRAGGAGEKMPEREAIAGAGLGKNGIE